MCSTTAPVQDQELRKSIIYFNILNSDSCEVPKYMKKLFDEMQLEPPVILPLGL